MSTETNFITLYKEAELADGMAVERRGDAWKALSETHLQHKKDDDWMAALKIVEDKHMEDMYGDVPEAKKSNGDWKYRKFKFVNSDGADMLGGLPMAYMSAKSTLKQARENSVQMLKKGKVLSKDSMTKAISKAKDTTTTYQKAINHVQRIRGLWIDLNTGEKMSMLKEISELPVRTVSKPA